MEFLKTVACPCGQVHTFSQKSIQDYVERLIAQLGEHLIVFANNQRYEVSRFYICFHGLATRDLMKLASQGTIKEV